MVNTYKIKHLTIIGLGLEQKFSHRFTGTIWNMTPTPNANLLVLEVRDEENFIARFSAFDLEHNEFLWRNLELDEKWWVSLVTASDGLALLQTFQSSGNPERKDLIAIDLSRGQVKWKAQKFALYACGEEGFILGYDSTQELMKATVDARTGEVSIGNWRSGVVNPAEVTKSPVTYAEGEDHFEQVKEFVQKRRNEHITRGVEYLELGDRILLSYYVANGEFLANYLLVTDNDGKELLHEKLGENLHGLGVHTFFALRDCVIFVKNKCELVSYSLYD